MCSVSGKNQSKRNQKWRGWHVWMTQAWSLNLLLGWKPHCFSSALLSLTAITPSHSLNHTLTLQTPFVFHVSPILRCLYIKCNLSVILSIKQNIDPPSLLNNEILKASLQHCTLVNSDHVRLSGLFVEYLSYVQIQALGMQMWFPVTTYDLNNYPWH